MYRENLLTRESSVVEITESANSYISEVFEIAHKIIWKNKLDI